jgi:hypothetical protein
MHAEIRGRGRSWTVWTPDPSARAMPVPVYDVDGDFKEWIYVGAPVDEKRKYIQSYGGPFVSVEEATEYARYLGYPEVNVIKTKTKTEALAIARKARQKGDTTDE